MGDQSNISRLERFWFWALLALAVLLRALQFSPFAMHHPDEVLQYIEPAYRLLAGEGIVTWEYRYGMRSWLLPMLLAGPMALGKTIGGTALAGIIAARLVAAMVALIPVIAGWHLGRRLSPTHGIVAMGAMALWYEQIVFSTHLLTESLATSLFLGAAALVSGEASRRRIIAAGTLLAFAVVLRFHYSIAVAVFVLLRLGSDWKRWRWLIMGAVPVVALSGTVDLIMGQWPFEWIWRNIQMNLVEGRSARFGTDGPGFFVEAIWGQWGWLTPLIVVLAIAAGRTYRPLLFAALFNLAIHSAIGHKEYRFIELTSAALVLLAAIGSVNAVRWIQERLRQSWPAVPATAALVLAWAGASAWLGRDRPLDHWFGERNAIELGYLAGRDPRVCGIGIMMVDYWQLSRAYIGRPMPVILLDNEDPPLPRLKPPGREQASVNAVIAPPASARLLPGYAAQACRAEDPYRRCLYVRRGGCHPTLEAEHKEIQRVLARVDM